MVKAIKDLLWTATGMIFLVVTGLVAFLINLWIVVTGANLLSLSVDGNSAVLAAALLGAAAMFGSKKRK